MKTSKMLIFMMLLGMIFALSYGNVEIGYYGEGFGNAERDTTVNPPYPGTGGTHILDIGNVTMGSTDSAFVIFNINALCCDSLIIDSLYHGKLQSSTDSVSTLTYNYYWSGTNLVKSDGDLDTLNYCMTSRDSFVVYFTPDTLGLVEDTVRVRSHWTGTYSSTALWDTVIIRGTGLGGHIELNPATGFVIDTLEFGGSYVETWVQIKNTGTATLTVDSVRMGGWENTPLGVDDDGNTIIQLKSTIADGTTIAVGDSESIKIRVNPDSINLWTDTLIVFAGTAADTVALQLQADVYGEAEMFTTPDSTLLKWGNVVVNDSVAKSLIIGNVAGSSDTLVIDSIKFLTGYTFYFHGADSLEDGAWMDAGDDSTVIVYYQPSAVGAAVDTLQIIAHARDYGPNSSNSDTYDTLNIVLTATGVMAGVNADPDTVAFGNVGINSTPSSNVYIYNTGTSPLTVDSVAIDNIAEGVFTLSTVPLSSPIAAGDSSYVTLTFAPDSIKSETDTIRVYCSGIDTVKVAMTGTGYGQAILQVAPDPISFSNTYINTTDTLQVVLTNSASATDTLYIDGISFVTADAIYGKTTTTGSSIAIGATDTFEVMYSPTAVGTHTNALYIDYYDNYTGAGNATRDTVQITGTSRPPLSYGGEITGMDSIAYFEASINFWTYSNENTTDSIYVYLPSVFNCTNATIKGTDGLENTVVVGDGNTNATLIKHATHGLGNNIMYVNLDTETSSGDTVRFILENIAIEDTTSTADSVVVYYVEAPAYVLAKDTIGSIWYGDDLNNSTQVEIDSLIPGETSPWTFRLNYASNPIQTDLTQNIVINLNALSDSPSGAGNGIDLSNVSTDPVAHSFTNFDVDPTGIIVNTSANTITLTGAQYDEGVLLTIVINGIINPSFAYSGSPGTISAYAASRVTFTIPGITIGNVFTAGTVAGKFRVIGEKENFWIDNSATDLNLNNPIPQNGFLVLHFHPDIDLSAVDYTDIYIAPPNNDNTMFRAISDVTTSQYYNPSSANFEWKVADNEIWLKNEATGMPNDPLVGDIPDIWIVNDVVIAPATAGEYVFYMSTADASESTLDGPKAMTERVTGGTGVDYYAAPTGTVFTDPLADDDTTSVSGEYDAISFTLGAATNDPGAVITSGYFNESSLSSVLSTTDNFTYDADRWALYASQFSNLSYVNNGNATLLRSYGTNSGIKDGGTDFIDEDNLDFIQGAATGGTTTNINLNTYTSTLAAGDWYLYLVALDHGKKVRAKSGKLIVRHEPWVDDVDPVVAQTLDSSQRLGSVDEVDLDFTFKYYMTSDSGTVKLYYSEYGTYNNDTYWSATGPESSIESAVQYIGEVTGLQSGDAPSQAVNWSVITGGPSGGIVPKGDNYYIYAIASNSDGSTYHVNRSASSYAVKHRPNITASYPKGAMTVTTKDNKYLMIGWAGSNPAGDIDYDDNASIGIIFSTTKYASGSDDAANHAYTLLNNSSLESSTYLIVKPLASSAENDDDGYNDYYSWNLTEEAAITTTPGYIYLYIQDSEGTGDDYAYVMEDYPITFSHETGFTFLSPVAIPGHGPIELTTAQKLEIEWSSQDLRSYPNPILLVASTVNIASNSIYDDSNTATNTDFEIQYLYDTDGAANSGHFGINNGGTMDFRGNDANAWIINADWVDNAATGAVVEAGDANHNTDYYDMERVTKATDIIDPSVTSQYTWETIKPYGFNTTQIDVANYPDTMNTVGTITNQAGSKALADGTYYIYAVEDNHHFTKTTNAEVSGDPQPKVDASTVTSTFMADINGLTLTLASFGGATANDKKIDPDNNLPATNMVFNTPGGGTLTIPASYTGTSVAISGGTYSGMKIYFEGGANELVVGDVWTCDGFGTLSCGLDDESYCDKILQVAPSEIELTNTGIPTYPNIGTTTSYKTFSRGKSQDIDIQINSHGATVDLIEIYLDVPKDLFTIADNNASSGLTGTDTVGVTNPFSFGAATGMFDDGDWLVAENKLVNTSDTTMYYCNFVAYYLSETEAPDGDILCSITLNCSGTSTPNGENYVINFANDPGESRITKLQNDGSQVASALIQNPAVKGYVLKRAKISGQVPLQGRTTVQGQASGTYADTITFSLHEPGNFVSISDSYFNTTNDQNTSSEDLQYTTNDEGEFTFTGVPEGVYELSAITNGHLRGMCDLVVYDGMHSTSNIPTTISGTDYQVLLAGDCAGASSTPPDNRINDYDVAYVLNTRWGSTTGDGNYVEYADFNRDGEINVTDLSFISDNYFVNGTIPYDYNPFDIVPLDNDNAILTTNDYEETVKEGQEFTIELIAKNIADLKAYSFILDYPERFELVDVQFANFASGFETIDVRNDYNNSIELGQAIKYMVQGASGSGALATLTFVACEDSEVEFDVRESKIVNSGHVENEFRFRPKNFSLKKVIRNVSMNQNYPNPFNPVTTISYDIPFKQNVELKVYNVKGQLVKTLVNEEVDFGSHTIIWNGKNDNNDSVSSGVYFYKLVTAEKVLTKKMIMLK